MKRPRLEVIKEEEDVEEEEEEEDEEENHHDVSSTSPLKKKQKKSELKCELCDTVCQSISHLQSHTLSEHVPSRKTPTPSHCCGVLLPSETSLMDDVNASLLFDLQPSPVAPAGGAPGASSSCSASNNTPVQQPRVACQQCEDTFETFAQFAAHMRSHIGSGSGSSSALTQAHYYCPVCPVGVVFRDKKSQIEHITIQHVQMQLTQFVCTECESIFASGSSLAHHFWETHVKRKYVCAQCDFVADTDKVFKEHAKAHSRQIVMFGCAVCGSAFAGQASLVSHVQMAHDQESIYPPTLLSKPSTTPSPKPLKPRALQCSVCDETVFGEDGLDEHRLQRHCKVRYADRCADCHERIDSDSSFVEHCLRHAKDHAHHCPVCRQSLRSDAQIHAHCAYHMKKPESPNQSSDFKRDDDFTNVYNFVCPICGEKTDDGFALIEHSKQHL